MRVAIAHQDPVRHIHLEEEIRRYFPGYELYPVYSAFQLADLLENGPVPNVLIAASDLLFLDAEKAEALYETILDYGIRCCIVRERGAVTVWPESTREIFRYDLRRGEHGLTVLLKELLSGRVPEDEREMFGSERLADETGDQGMAAGSLDLGRIDRR